MFDTFLIDHPLVAVGIWIVVYVSDYYLTLWGARLFKNVAGAFIDMEGSYEIEQVWQKDVDALRHLSPQFLYYLGLSSAVFLAVWWYSVRYINVPGLFLFAFGSFVLTQVVVHMRHVRNILYFRSLRTPGAIEGRIKYARWASERTSAVDLVCFAALFVLCYLLSERVMFLGGALGCLGSARRHWRQARRARV